MGPRVGRRRFLRTYGAGSVAVAGAVGGAVLAGCLEGPQPRQVTMTESFESGLGDWDSRGHVGDDAGGEFDWAIEVTDERAATGDHSLAIFTEGTHDDGTAWIVKPVELVEGTAYDVRGRVRAWAESESFNTIRHLVVSVAPEEPTAESDFPGPNVNSTGQQGLSAGGLREPLDRVAGWSDYTFEWATPELASKTLSVAVGVTVVWESDRTDYLDAVKVDFVPRTD